jgi:hypothetical protein
MAFEGVDQITGETYLFINEFAVVGHENFAFRHPSPFFHQYNII